MALCMHGQGKRRNETRCKGFLCVSSVGIMVGSFLLTFLEEQKTSVSEVVVAWHFAQALYFILKKKDSIIYNSEWTVY